MTRVEQNRMSTEITDIKLSVESSFSKNSSIDSNRISHECQQSNKAEELEKEIRLHQFDLNDRYGPYIGIDRLARWERAECFGLSPPIRIWQLLHDQG